MQCVIYLKFWLILNGKIQVMGYVFEVFINTISNAKILLKNIWTISVVYICFSIRFTFTQNITMKAPDSRLLSVLTKLLRKSRTTSNVDLICDMKSPLPAPEVLNSKAFLAVLLLALLSSLFCLPRPLKILSNSGAPLVCVEDSRKNTDVTHRVMPKVPPVILMVLKKIGLLI